MPRSHTKESELLPEVDFHAENPSPGALWPPEWQGRHYYRTTVRFHRVHLGSHVPRSKGQRETWMRSASVLSDEGSVSTGTIQVGRNSRVRIPVRRLTDRLWETVPVLT